MKEAHPYKKQPPAAFWSQTVSKNNFLDIDNWYTKKWAISKQPIATAGSCFAQHIGRHMRTSGFNFLDMEPPPVSLDESLHQDYGYNVYSARFGNVYTARQLLQLIQRALGEFKPAEEAWALDKGFVDPFRPAIEAEPFSSEDEVRASRKSHLEAVAHMFERVGVFVFTLGLTEAWCSKTDGSVFPICPGTKGGEYSSTAYELRNFSCDEVVADLTKVIRAVKSINSSARFLFTVSPVPLVATATTNQVVVATTYSKSVLRAAAGMLADKHNFVDYFPSYEIITAPAGRGMFFEPDMRSVSRAGVAHVMKQFFKEHKPQAKRMEITKAPDNDDDVKCEEILLEVFGNDR